MSSDIRKYEEENDEEEDKEFESVSSKIEERTQEKGASPVLIEIKQASSKKNLKSRRKENLRDFVRRESQLFGNVQPFKWDLEENSPRQHKKSQFSRNHASLELGGKSLSVVRKYRMQEKRGESRVKREPHASHNSSCSSAISLINPAASNEDDGSELPSHASVYSSIAS